MRLDFFGDEIESIRKFDLGDAAIELDVERGAAAAADGDAGDGALAARSDQCAADAIGIDGRGCGDRRSGETPRELQTHMATRTGEATVFPGMGVFCSRWQARR